MKLIVQIPCYNEAESLPATMAELPRRVPGFSVVEYLVVDDGSTDNTAEIARRLGVHHVVSHPANRGLAAAFMTGVTAAVALGADVVVNTDGDNQYVGADIAALTEPILDGRADIVIGARPIASTTEFSVPKRLLQRLGSWVVRLASRTSVEDAPSGFRAFTREAAMRLHVFSRYTYTLETIIQAGHSNMRVLSVPVHTNPSQRPSRLVRSIPRYLAKSFSTILRVSAVYQPMFFFCVLAIGFAAVGLAAGGRFLYDWMYEDGAGHIQSVVLSAACMTLAFFSLAIGFLADITAVNRRLLETIDWRIQMLGERRPQVRPGTPNPREGQEAGPLAGRAASR